MRPPGAWIAGPFIAFTQCFIIKVAVLTGVFYDKIRMVENLIRSLLSGLIAAETFSLILYPGYVGQFGSKTKAFRTTLQVALSVFVVFGLVIFVVGLFCSRGL